MKQLIWNLVAVFLLSQPQIDPRAQTIILRYVDAIGGSAAIASVTSRVTRGMFDNGRGLVEPFVTWTRVPDHVATIIGRRDIADAGGSGRATDGQIGWDKNFVGTGLRDITGSELADFKRLADPFRAARLPTTCASLSVEDSRDVQIIRCALGASMERWFFHSTSGLVDRVESVTDNGRALTTFFEDYQRADGILVPFRERIVVPGATITYTASSIHLNEAVPDSVFVRPAR